MIKTYNYDRENFSLHFHVRNDSVNFIVSEIRICYIITNLPSDVS